MSRAIDEFTCFPDVTPRDRRPRLLVAVAHPDDETFGCGSLLLRAAAEGWVTAVCCGTRGEAGEVAPGVTVAPHGLGAVREAELRAAARVLKVDRLAMLDFEDSGMTDAVTGSMLVAAPEVDVAAALQEFAVGFQPDVLVTLDASDGHRDHARMRDAAVRVATALGVPAYLHCLPRSLLQRWVTYMSTHRPDAAHLQVDELGCPDELITLRLDTRDQLPDRLRAIAEHRSQVSPFEGLPDDLRDAFLTTEHLRRAG